MRSEVIDGDRTIENRPDAVAPLIVAVGGMVAAAVGTSMFTTSYDVWGGFLVAPILFLITLPVIRSQARMDGDVRAAAFLQWTLLLKFIVGVAAWWIAFRYYGPAADAYEYSQLGLRLAPHFRAFDLGVRIPGGVVGTGFPAVLDGLIYSVIGPTTLGASLVFAWIGFIGQLLCYRAFRIGVPDGRSTSYRRLVFLLPSILFWSSLMGKDGWMLLGLGLAALGVARLLTSNARRAIVPLLLGVGAMLLVRPHVAALVGVAAAIAYVARSSASPSTLLTPLAKFVGVVVLAFAAFVLVRRAEMFLNSEGLTTRHGVTSVLRQASRGADYGGSNFTPIIVSDPLQIPAAAFTVTFRPLLTETSSLFALLSAYQGMFLLALTLFRIPSVLAGVRLLRRRPYITFAFVYCGMFVVAFAALANFGLLDRERVQFYPVYLILLALPVNAQGGSRRWHDAGSRISPRLTSPFDSFS